MEGRGGRINVDVIIKNLVTVALIIYYLAFKFDLSLILNIIQVAKWIQKYWVLFSC